MCSSPEAGVLWAAFEQSAACNAYVFMGWVKWSAFRRRGRTGPQGLGCAVLLKQQFELLWAPATDTCYSSTRASTLARS